jgi:uncharacterized membrane protein YdfJ with MMPL/SSD domain
MDQAQPAPPNLAARAGRWSAKHRKAAIVGWLAFVLVAFALGTASGTEHIPQLDQGAGESGRAERVLHDSFRQNLQEEVLVQSRDGRSSDPQFKRAVADLVAALRATGDATSIKSPFGPGNAGQLSHDGYSALVSFEIARTAGADAADSSQVDKVDRLLRATATAQRAHPEVRIGEFGDASASKAFDKALGNDLKRSEQLSLPITLVILIFAFGAFVAAGIPLLLAATAVAAALGLTSLASQLSPVDPSISEVVVLIGMAVGVDYSLFYLRREREERAAGRSKAAALEAAAASSGRSVLVSGLTVMVAMAGMYLTGDKAFASIATGTIIVVAVAVIGSLTVLPAVLSMLGDRVMKLRVPFVARRREQGRESRAWNAVLKPVVAHPKLAAALSAGALAALAVPALGLHTGDLGAEGLPRGLAITQTLNRMQTAFPGTEAPAIVVVESADVRSPAVQQAVARLRRVALQSGSFRGPVDTSVASSHRVLVLALPITGRGTDGRSEHALELLRERMIPATIGRVPGSHALVSGLTASSQDYDGLMRSHAPLVFGFVLVSAFLLLMVTFRSVVIALKAVVLNLMSVAASYGVLALVFQHGWGESLLGFKATGTVVSWLPIFLFVVLFGLSMDYHIFIVSRMREAFDRGLSTDRAIEEGIKSTAGVVTSAAAVMIGVFAVFGTLGALLFKQLGVGLAAAILIDATIVRAILLPATMKLLGEWNWYLPRSLEWLPCLGRAPAADPGRA